MEEKHETLNQGRYGLRAMLDIAQHYHDGLVMVKTLPRGSRYQSDIWNSSA